MYLYIPYKITSDDIKSIPKVIILTPKQINEKAKEVLIKYGLKFTPRPRSDHVELKTDTKKFCRKLRLLEYTADTDGNSDDVSLKKNPSTFTPEALRNVTLDTYIDFISKYPFEEILRDQNKSRPSLRKDEWKTKI